MLINLLPTYLTNVKYFYLLILWNKVFVNFFVSIVEE